MSKISLAMVVLLATLVHLEADNVLQNGDFTDGSAHWSGDGHPSGELTDLVALPDSLAKGGGLAIKLKSFDWTKISQDFAGGSSTGMLTITFAVTPDLSFSNRPEDYKNMPDHIDYDAWKSFNSKRGEWVIFISDFDKNRGSYYSVKPTLGTTTSQSVRMKVKGLSPSGDKTLTLAFPPGTGTIVILSVELTAK